MTAKVFIDGEVGTTGLQIRERLVGRKDIELISLGSDVRKDLGARLDAFARADVGILCLPDASVHELMPHLDGADARVIDASTAHRVHPDWAFGFPELGADFRDRIAKSARVSNPGCYSTGAISLLRPLVEAGIIARDAALTINAVSGYSGGGRQMVEEFETGATDGFFVYATGQNHKHVPEILRYGMLDKRPVFVPSVGQFRQGMIVQIPLAGLDADTARSLAPALARHYEGSRFISVVEPESYGPRMDPRKLNNTNRLELSVHGDPDKGCMVLMALLDNLGKGASGAAVQNLNIMLGIDEASGL